MGNLVCFNRIKDTDETLPYIESSRRILLFFVSFLQQDSDYASLIQVDDGKLILPTPEQLPRPPTLLHLGSMSSAIPSCLPASHSEVDTMTSSKRFKYLRELGRGRFAVARLAVDGLTGDEVVVKSFAKQRSTKPTYAFPSKPQPLSRASSRCPTEIPSISSLYSSPMALLHALTPPPVSHTLYGHLSQPVSAFSRASGDPNRHIFHQLRAGERIVSTAALLHHLYSHIHKLHLFFLRTSSTYHADFVSALLVLLFLQAAVSKLARAAEVVETMTEVRVVEGPCGGSALAHWNPKKERFMVSKTVLSAAEAELSRNADTSAMSSIITSIKQGTPVDITTTTTTTDEPPTAASLSPPQLLTSAQASAVRERVKHLTRDARRPARRPAPTPRAADGDDSGSDDDGEDVESVTEDTMLTSSEDESEDDSENSDVEVSGCNAALTEQDILNKYNSVGLCTWQSPLPAASSPFAATTGRDTLKTVYLREHAFQKLVRQLITALAALGVSGVVHRDLKPGNVCVSEGSVCRLIDYTEAECREASADDLVATPSTDGETIAEASLLAMRAVMGAQGGSVPSSTSTAAPVPWLRWSGPMVNDSAGTTAFTAPEFCDDKYAPHNDEFDATVSDVYQMGAVLYSVATGCLPFHAYLHPDSQPNWISNDFCSQVAAVVGDHCGPLHLHDLYRDCLENGAHPQALQLLENPVYSPPFPAFPPHAAPVAYDCMIFNIIAENPLVWPTECFLCLEGRDLIARMMEKNASSRIQWDKIIQHPYFLIDFESLLNKLT